MAVVNVWEEEGEVRCKAKLKGKKFENAQSVKFEFLLQPNGAVAASVDATVKSAGFRQKSAEAVWKPPKVPDDKVFQKYHYRLMIDGKTAVTLPEEVIAWAREIKITAKFADGNPAPGAMIRIRQVDPPPTKGEGRTAPQQRVVRTDPNGVITYRMPYPSEIETAVARPWGTDGGGWTVPGGRKREVTVTRGFIAAFDWPLPARDPHRQWVNLPAAPTKPEQGEVLKVKIKPVRAEDAEVGDKVYVKVTYTASNSARKPRGNERRPGTVDTHELVLSAQKTCSLDVTLMPSGGDRVEIKIGGTPATEDATLMVETWRKLFYGLAAPAFMSELEDDTNAAGNTVRGLPAAVRAQLKTILDATFIEYQLHDSAVGGTYPAHQVLKADYLSLTGRDRLVQTTADYDTNTPVAPPGTGPRTVLMKLCDLAYDEETTRVTAQPLVDTQPFFYPFADTHDLDVFTRSILDGSDAISVAGCTWEADVTGLVFDRNAPHPAFTNTGAARSGPVSRSWIVPNNLWWLEIVFPEGSVPKALVAPTDGSTPVGVKVTFMVRVPEGGVNGCALGTRQLMVLKPASPKCMAATLSHELGHSMGMTITPKMNKVPYGMPAPKHVDGGGVYYRNPLLPKDKAGKGGVRPCHQGPHCASGLDATLATFSGLAGSCVMFGEGGSDDAKAREGFCDECTKYVKARNIADISTSFMNRADDQC